MPKKSGEVVGDVSLGTDAWNVADGYTKLKILRQLIQLDRYETISQFGTEDIDEEILQGLTPNQIFKRRIEALERFVATLRQLLGNVRFAIKKKDKEVIASYFQRVNNVEPYLQKVYSINEDQVTHEELIVIDEKMFRQVLDILIKVKDEINTPFNNANLIFRASEEMDLEKIMDEIVAGG